MSTVYFCNDLTMLFGARGFGRRAILSWNSRAHRRLVAFYSATSEGPSRHEHLKSHRDDIVLRDIYLRGLQFGTWEELEGSVPACVALGQHDRLVHHFLRRCRHLQPPPAHLWVAIALVAAQASFTSTKHFLQAAEDLHVPQSAEFQCLALRILAPHSRKDALRYFDGLPAPSCHTVEALMEVCAHHWQDRDTALRYVSSLDLQRNLHLVTPKTLSCLAALIIPPSHPGAPLPQRTAPLLSVNEVRHLDVLLGLLKAITLDDTALPHDLLCTVLSAVLHCRHHDAWVLLPLVKHHPDGIAIELGHDLVKFLVDAEDFRGAFEILNIMQEQHSETIEYHGTSLVPEWQHKRALFVSMHEVFIRGLLVTDIVSTAADCLCGWRFKPDPLPRLVEDVMWACAGRGASGSVLQLLDLALTEWHLPFTESMQRSVFRSLELSRDVAKADVLQRQLRAHAIDIPEDVVQMLSRMNLRDGQS